MTVPVCVNVAVLAPGAMPVRHLHVSVAGDQDVVGFNVAVNESLFVGRLERQANSFGDVECLRDRQPALLTQYLLQVATFDVLHHDVMHVAVGPDVKYVHDVRMGKAGRRLGLTPEAFDEVGVRGVLGPEHLDRDASAEDTVARAIDDGHTAFAASF